MAIRFPLPTDYLTRTTSLGVTSSDFTIALQAESLTLPPTVNVDYQTQFALFVDHDDYVQGSLYIFIFNIAGIPTLFLYANAPGDPVGVMSDPLPLQIDQWAQGGVGVTYTQSSHHLQLSYAGASVGSAITVNLTGVVWTIAYVGSDLGTAGVGDGALSSLRLWQAKLTGTELQLEGARQTAQRTANLLFDSPFTTSATVSGWTVNGAPATTTGPFNGKWFLTSGTSWIGLETDGNPITIEAIGAGGAGGHVINSGVNTAPGGGGGAYATARVSYASASSVTGIQIGVGGVGGTGNTASTDGTDTIWNTSIVIAKAGKKGDAATAAAGAGGSAAACTPMLGAFSGGAGGAGGSASSNQSGSGGGGAAGPFGAGSAGGGSTGGVGSDHSGAGGGGNGGGASTAGVTVGMGDGSAGGTAEDGTPGGAGGLASPSLMDPPPTVGADGVNGSGGGGGGGLRNHLTALHGQSGGQGGAGIEFDAWHGAGGGGGGSGANENSGGISDPGGPGGLYGGGGGGGGWEYSGANSGAGGAGGAGLIAITYTPLPLPAPAPLATLPIRVLRQFGPFSDENVMLFVANLQVLMETGVGLTTGQGSDPQLMLSWSKDYGHTWSPEVWLPIGKIGEYMTRVRLAGNLGQGRGWCFRVVVTDPIPVTFLQMTADVTKGTS